ncbi:hypothetical protein J6590_070161 [Homalodisca vitripennis]|nr:hypothetical protein J6590_070161 [Homalodisca vitripennis]
MAEHISESTAANTLTRGQMSDETQRRSEMDNGADSLPGAASAKPPPGAHHAERGSRTTRAQLPVSVAELLTFDTFVFSQYDRTNFFRLSRKHIYRKTGYDTITCSSAKCFLDLTGARPNSVYVVEVDFITLPR